MGFFDKLFARGKERSSDVGREAGDLYDKVEHKLDRWADDGGGSEGASGAATLSPSVTGRPREDPVDAGWEGGAASIGPDAQPATRKAEVLERLTQSRRARAAERRRVEDAQQRLQQLEDRLSR